jgi:hypothetical protein
MPVDTASLYRTEPAALHEMAVREIFRNTLILGKPPGMLWVMPWYAPSQRNTTVGSVLKHGKFLGAI